MAGDGRFNIRVYGIMIVDGQVLVNDELIKGHQIIKFPGGGLEYGEGTIDCLKREWMEELDIAIEVKSHFYTTDYFQPSAFDDSQVFSIYYLVAPTVAIDKLENKVDTEKTAWLPLSAINESIFTLPIDKRVGEMLQANYLAGSML